jgi:hypothetical protein
MSQSESDSALSEEDIQELIYSRTCTKDTNFSLDLYIEAADEDVRCSDCNEMKDRFVVSVVSFESETDSDNKYNRHLCVDCFMSLEPIKEWYAADSVAARLRRRKRQEAKADAAIPPPLRKSAKKARLEKR